MSGPVLKCGMCGMPNTGPLWRIPELMHPVCASCYGMMRELGMRHVEPVPVTLQPRQCFHCGYSEEMGPLFHCAGVPMGNGLCSRCLGHWHDTMHPGQMYVRAPLPRVPKALESNPYQTFKESVDDAVMRLAGLPRPAGVQSGENSTGPKVMRYMDREETIAYVAAWLRWVGSLSMSKPRFHHILRLNPPDEVSEPPDPRKEDEQP